MISPKKSKSLCRPKYLIRYKMALWYESEAGEVTVAWVVLVAASIALTIAILASVGGGTQDLSDDMSSELTQQKL